jgi:threonyl-tRNA synthetase
MPSRFELKYVNEKGELEQPVVIHRSSIGALERVMGFLIEKYAGAFPVWLAPIQATVIPISEKNNEYAKKVSETLKSKGLRVELDDRDDTMQSKIRAAQMQKVPYMLVLGDREAEKSEVSMRLRTGENLGAKPLDEVVEKINSKYLTKSLDLW